MICIHDQRLPEHMVEKLRLAGFFPVRTLDLPGLSSSISTHPDIQVCKISDQLIVVEPSTYDYYKNILQSYGIIVRPGRSILQEPYPKDSAYNLAANESLAIHNFRFTDSQISQAVDDLGLEKISVNQGYGKCNILFTKTGLITSDQGIYKALGPRKKLLIRPGFIDLEDYTYGFIGGASGFFKGKLYFLGDPSLHPDFPLIEKFLQEDQTSYSSLSSDPLRDYGTLIFLQGGING
ncbi:MAG: hypothetical protein Q4E36_00900 [Bacillota bacterium]|nr:hypothetical protein [Bacillota bacterium]